jgi:hypothetical protein
VTDPMKDLRMRPEMLKVLADIRAERDRQDKRWGQQSLPDGTGSTSWPVPISARGSRGQRDIAQARCRRAAKRGEVTWRHVLLEEVTEAFAESDRHKLRAELVQIAAVTAAWIEHIDRRPTPLEAFMQSMRSIGTTVNAVLSPRPSRQIDWGLVK